ncbi:hypothetical protein [Ktedonobacter racemifer]|uniref:Uncharacterized protein n=1 Tax=Ktedonobacter racemifer DSM 44963 TaxID=485913 RepID=D6U0C4_KTERA|nr:hypothetical protein [Ktedonobacter racemifer]EFH82264.1 hypothetical protein Krac_3056 [Ktedonobacter racemifer DSM 44963]
METQPFNFDKTKAVRPQAKAPASPAKPMLKARALSLANTFKRGTALTSLATFGIVGALIAYPQFQTVAKPTHSSSTVKHMTPATSTSQKSNSFFQQQEGNNLGSQDALQGTSTTTPTATSAPAYTQGGSNYTPPAVVNNTPSYSPQGPVSGSRAS